MLKKYSPDYADFFFNCASSMTGEGIQMGIDAGGYVECENRALPAFLSSYKSKFELAFIHQSAPGIMVNIKGDNIGNIVSDNHYTMAKAKLNKATATPSTMCSTSPLPSSCATASPTASTVTLLCSRRRGCALRQRGRRPLRS